MTILARFGACLLAVSFVGLATPTPALAAPSSDPVDPADEARAAMRRGAALLERGDAAGALAEYETAKRLVPAANAPWFFAAEALTRLERWAEVVENLEAYLARDPNVSDAEQVRARVTRVRHDHFPAHVHLDIRTTDQREASPSVTVDGVIAALPANGVIDLAPGRHTIAVAAPTYESTSKELDLIGDQTTTLIINLTHVAKAPPPDRVVVQESPSRDVPWKSIGLVTAGVGAAGLIVAGILDATALRSTLDDYDRAAARGDVRGAADDLSSARSMQTGLLVTYIVSSVVLIGGATLFMLAPSSSKPMSARQPTWSF